MAAILAGVACLTMSLTSCGKKESDDRLEAIRARGYIEMCTEPYFAPYEFIDPTKTGDEQYRGVDIEIANYIADKLGVELRITPLDFTAVLAGVADGKYDIAISAIAYAPSRAEAMRLSDVYYSAGTGYGFVVRTEDADKYTDIASLADAVVITQSGSVQEALYNQYVGGACKEFKLVANMTDAYLAVAEGKADVHYRYGAFMKEWDTAGMEILCKEAGASFTDVHGAPLCANRADPVNRNGFRILNAPESALDTTSADAL